MIASNGISVRALYNVFCGKFVVRILTLFNVSIKINTMSYCDDQSDLCANMNKCITQL